MDERGLGWVGLGRMGTKDGGSGGTRARTLVRSSLFCIVAIFVTLYLSA